MRSFYASHYRTGEEIRAGDRVSWAGAAGRVVFVLGAMDFPLDWASWQSTESWLGKGDAEGFMLDVEGAGLVFQPASDEDLDFVARMA